MKKAIIIGASSGIGYDLAKVLSSHGYELGIAARRLEPLLQLQQELPTKSIVRQFDIAQIPASMEATQAMIQELGGADLIIINAGIGFLNPELDWEKEKQTIDVNLTGFCAIANVAYKHFSQQGHGYLVGISSIGALRGNDIAPAYNASKAFMSNYLEGLRKKAYREGKNILVTDIKPGFVDTRMAQSPHKFWVASTQKAANQIYTVIQKGKKHAYITRRWRLIGWLLKCMPNWLFQRI